MELDLKIYKRVLTLLLGLCLFIFGFTNLAVDFTSPRTLSDQEIIQRAKALGLIEMKDLYKDSLEKENKDTPQDAPKENQK